MTAGRSCWVEMRLKWFLDSKRWAEVGWDVLLVELGYRKVRIFLLVPLGTVDEKGPSAYRLKPPDSIFMSKERNKAKGDFWPSVPAGCSWRLLFSAGAFGHQRLVWFWRTTLKSDEIWEYREIRQWKFFPRRRETVSAPSSRWSEQPGLLNDGSSRASPFCLSLSLHACTRAEVICLLGIESVAAVPAPRCGIS